MRNNILVFALLFCGGFFLAAQTRTDVAIYVSPVTGRGSKPDDNFLFYNRLLNELAVQKANLTNASKDADYSLFGSLAPSRNGVGQYVFHLGLWDKKIGGFTVEGELLYEVPDDTNQLFSALVKSLLYTIPAKPVPTEPLPTDPLPPEPPLPEPPPPPDWRDDWLYLGAAGTWTPRRYVDDKDGYIYPGYPHFGLSAEIHFLDRISFEAGLEVATDTIVYRDNSGKLNEKLDKMIEIPLLLKYVFKPGSYFMIEPYIGAQINYSLDKVTQPPLFSMGGGIQLGVKAGPGALFLDGRILWDAQYSTIKIPSGDLTYYRYIFHLGLGYKYGFFPR